MSVPRFTDFEIAVLPTAQLGEGPRWDTATATLLWVDVPLKTVHRYDPVTGEDTVQKVSDVVSLALPRRRGGVVVGLPDGLHFLNGKQSIGLVAIESERTDTRTNDGACDAAGRLWVGTMALDERSPVAGALSSGPRLQRDDRPHRDHDLERARLEPVGDKLLLHRQPDLPRRRLRLRPGDWHAREPAAVRRRRGRGRRPRRPDRRRRGLRLGSACTEAGASTATRPTASSSLRCDCPWPRSRAAASAETELRDLYVTTRRDGLSDAEVAEQPLSGRAAVPGCRRGRPSDRHVCRMSAERWNDDET